MAKRIYPHVDAVQDPAVQQLVRLLWDKIGECEEKILAVESVLSKLKSVSAKVPKLERDIIRIQGSIAKFI